MKGAWFMQMRDQWQRLGVYFLIVLLTMSLLTGCLNHSQTEQSKSVDQQQSVQHEVQAPQFNESEALQEPEAPNKPAVNKQQSDVEAIEKEDPIREDSDDDQVEITAKEETVSKEPIVLTLKGNGLKQSGSFTLTGLKDMKGGYAEQVYSAVNNWPSKKFFVGKGIKITYLLDKLGLKDDAKTIIVKSEDGYKATFTKEQLLGQRYYYPNIVDESKDGQQIVPAIIAWENRESKDLSKAQGGNLMLLLGQKSLHDVTTNGFAKQVNLIEVLTSESGRWEDVTVSSEPGAVEAGTEISLNHSEMDRVKIYYTVGGSIPTYDSPVYNPSTSYFQPQLTQPVTVDEAIIIKAFASGFGKQDSEMTTFQYEVKK